MYNYLLDYAVRNIWAGMSQDRQVIVEPYKLSPPGGSRNRETVLRRSIKLPTQSDVYYVYQIGRLDPRFLDLISTTDQWMSLQASITKTNVLLEVYTNRGIQLPKAGCHYMTTREGDLILAITTGSRVPVNLEMEPIFFRSYINTYFNGVGVNNQKDGLVVRGRTTTSVDDIAEISTMCSEFEKLGHVTSYVNGYRVKTISLATANVGDTVEFVYDSSIKFAVELKVVGLDTFDSDLDKKRKYVVQYEGGDTQTVDFHDDIDFYLTQYDSRERFFRSVYIHRNPGDTVRMLTHRDYSLAVMYVEGFANDNQMGDPNTLYLTLQVKRTETPRTVGLQADRLFELYKLPYAGIKGALTGLNSTVPFWRAPALEASAWNSVMASHGPDFTKEDVTAALGYNAISKVVANSPVKTRRSGRRLVADAPYELQTRSTALEYDVSGALVKVGQHASGEEYACENPGTDTVEFRSGYSGTLLDEYYGQPVTKLPAQSSYRFYMCDYDPITGAPDNRWRDVTGTAFYTLSQDGVVTWNIDPKVNYTLVRTDDRNLYYRFNYRMVDGVIDFTLTHRMNRGGVIATYPMQVPMGNLKLVLNGRSLIQDLDYRFVFPRILVTCKEYLVSPTTQDQVLEVFYDGFCPPDLSTKQTNEVGFVDHNTLSRDGVYEVRDDKVERVVVNGAVKRRDQVSFSEDTVLVPMPDVREGAPYSIENVVVPIKATASSDTYTLLLDSLARDKIVSDYLTPFFPDKVYPTPSPIPYRYAIYSPYCSKLIFDLASGKFVDPRIEKDYDDMVLNDILKPYEYLLPFDPCVPGNTPDDKYVLIHPHCLNEPVTLGFYQYRLVIRAIRFKLGGLVDPSSFVKLS